MKNIFLLLFAIFFLAACEETIELDLDQTDDKIVIEGLVTSEFKQQQIKISKTNPFNTAGVTPRVSGATVTVEDDKGNTFSFQETETGIYLSSEPFSGTIGNTYTLTVGVEGQLFTASEELFRVATIDSMTYRINAEEQADPEDEGRFYEVLLYTKEPQETEDYYLFKFYRNGQIENGDGEFVSYADDVAIGNRIDGLPIPLYYAQGDVARFEMYSLTRKAFLYWAALEANINNDGGMFSGQPANVSTNIEGGAIGYFQVSDVAIEEVVVE